MVSAAAVQAASACVTASALPGVSSSVVNKLSDQTLNSANLEKRLQPAAYKLLAEALKRNTQLQELLLKNNAINREQGEIVAAALTQNRSLTQLDLSQNNLDPYAGKAIAEALKMNNSLKELDLGHNRLGPNEGRIFAEALMVTDCSLQALYLGYNKLGAAGGKAMAGALLVNCSLLTLDLSHNSLGIKAAGIVFAEFLKALAEVLKINQTLLTLDLRQNSLGEPNEKMSSEELILFAEALKAFAEALKANRTLQKLDLGDNNLGVEGFKAFAEVLKVNAHLNDLRLNGNKLGGEAINDFAESLKKNETLNILDLGQNNFGPKDAKALAEALKTNQSLHRLVLRDNKLGAEGGKGFGEALRKNRRIEHLVLSRTCLGPKGCKAIADGLKENPSLKELNLSDNDIGSEGCQALTEMLKVNRSLQHLELVFNKLRQEDGRMLERAFRVNFTLTSLLLWRDEITENPAETLNNQFSPESAQKIIHKLMKNKAAPTKSDQLKQMQDKSKQARESQEKTKKEAAVSLPPPLDTSLELAASSKLLPLDVAVGPLQLDASSPKSPALGKQAVNWTSLEVWQKQSELLARLLEREAKLEIADQERQHIADDPSLATYYYFFERLLTGTWLACQSINSKLVDNAQRYKSDHVGEGLKAIGGHVPVVGAFTSFFSGVIKVWNDRGRRQGVQRICGLFTETESAFKELGSLARKLTLAQEVRIKQIHFQTVSIVTKIKRRAQNLIANVLGDDANTPLQCMAITDCEGVINAIQADRISRRSKLNDFLTVIKENGGYEDTPAISTAVFAPLRVPAFSISSPTRSISSTSSSSPFTPSSPSPTDEVVASVKDLTERCKKNEQQNEDLKNQVKVLMESVSKNTETRGSRSATGESRNDSKCLLM